LLIDHEVPSSQLQRIFRAFSLDFSLPIFMNAAVVIEKIEVLHAARRYIQQAAKQGG